MGLHNIKIASSVNVMILLTLKQNVCQMSLRQWTQTAKIHQELSTESEIQATSWHRLSTM